MVCFSPPVAGKPTMAERIREHSPQVAQVTPSVVLIGQITTGLDVIPKLQVGDRIKKVTVAP